MKLAGRSSPRRYQHSNGAQGGSKAPLGGIGATRSPSFTGEHDENPPFDAPAHRGISAAAISSKLWYNSAVIDPETKSIFDRERDEVAEGAADAAADAEIEAGLLVSNDRVVGWLKPWGTPDELPCPEPEMS